MASLPFPRLEYASNHAKAKRKALMRYIQEMNEKEKPRIAARVRRLGRALKKQPTCLRVPENRCARPGIQQLSGAFPD
ncbi:hypothetical protein [Microbulbifer sp. S227A]|uniref:hypothetical protein n=1 Tax=Microbulbifer sp. S227A TaxID=3415131 RepID=UPI003C7B5FDC